MTVVQIETFAAAHWRWLAGALLAIALLLSGKCYGDAQYSRGRDLARADIADSVGRIYQEQYRALADSMAREMSSFRISVQAANDRAASAEARATAAETRASIVLTPQIIAKTPPEVLALIADLRSVNDTNRAVIADLRVHLDTALAREARYASALELADSAIAQKDRTIAQLRILKEPPHGFWHHVGIVAKYSGAVALGITAGIAIAH